MSMCGGRIHLAVNVIGPLVYLCSAWPSHELKKAHLFQRWVGDVKPMNRGAFLFFSSFGWHLTMKRREVNDLFIQKKQKNS